MVFYGIRVMIGRFSLCIHGVHTHPNVRVATDAAAPTLARATPRSSSMSAMCAVIARANASRARHDAPRRTMRAAATATTTMRRRGEVRGVVWF